MDIIFLFSYFQLKRNELRLDKILNNLDTELHRCSRKIEIPFDQQCALDNIDQIPQQIIDLNNRLENLKTKRNEYIKNKQTKLDKLEERSKKFLLK
mgnify:CR=1 FL=1